MLDDYRTWLESELALLGNASHHAYAFGQANMAKRAIEALDEALAKAAAPSRITFVELPAKAFAADNTFYTTVFGWSFAQFGPTYACTMTGDVDLGLQADAAEATAAPLAVIAVRDLEATLDAVVKAGGTITKPIFAFPGGRRFHFHDPSGNELAALKADD
jgi:predicted enzyme related to lactoylglutathione lyase